MVSGFGKLILDDAAQEDFAGRAADALEPGFQFRDLHIVESRFTDLDAERARVERGLAAPVGAAESLESERASLVKAFGGDFGDVVYAVIVAEAHEASTGLAHGRSLRLRLAFA